MVETREPASLVESVRALGDRQWRPEPDSFWTARHSERTLPDRLTAAGRDMATGLFARGELRASEVEALTEMVEASVIAALGAIEDQLATAVAGAVEAFLSEHPSAVPALRGLDAG